MKQTARNPTNYLHRRFFATIQDHYVYVLRCVHLYTPPPLSLSLSIPKSTHALPIFHALLSFHEFFDSRASKLSRRVFAFDVAFPPLFFTREKERNSSLLKRKKKRSVIVLQHVSSGWWDRSLVDARATGWKSFHDRETGWRTVEEEEVPLLSSPDGVETSRWERGGVDNEIRLGRELEELRSDDSRKV